jgi:hypothetical protein
MLELKITVEKVPLNDWEDVRFEYYKNGKNLSSWWTGESLSISPVVIDTLVEMIRAELERYVDSCR